MPCFVGAPGPGAIAATTTSLLSLAQTHAALPVLPGGNEKKIELPVKTYRSESLFNFLENIMEYTGSGLV